MDIFAVYLIAVAGDFIGDTVLYGLGRWGKDFIHKHGHYIGASAEKLEKAKVFFAEKHNKAIVMSKLFHGVGASGLVAAGVLAIPYRRYMKICFLIALAQAAAFLAIGLVFGQAYARIAHYLDIYAEGIGIAVVVLLVGTLIYKLAKR
jgi:membrane protein DedA with SNARE-associated domain